MQTIEFTKQEVAIATSEITKPAAAIAISRTPRLTARWVKENNQLVCQWIITEP